MLVNRLYPEQPLVGIGAVVICNGKILLEKRKGEPKSYLKREKVNPAGANGLFRAA